MMRSIALPLLFSLSILQALAQQPTGILEGIVVERITKAPLQGVNIVILNGNMGASTDEGGKFSIPNIPVGFHQVKVSIIGYISVTKTDVHIRRGLVTKITFDMNETAITTAEISVHDELFSKPREITTSFHSLSYEEVRRAPGSLEDVSRAVLSLPGVTFSGDMRNDLIVRGGSPLENLTMIENIEVPNINHFATQGASGGPIGMLNTEFIEDVGFLTGGFPARYGDKLSSAMMIDLRDGRTDRFGGKFNLSAGGIGGHLEGPLSDKGSWFLAARRSYLGFLIETFGFSGITIVPLFNDVQGKFTYDIDSQNRISIIGIGAMDHISFDNVNRENTGANPDLTGMDNVKGDQSAIAAGATWRRLWGTEGYTLATVSVNTNYYYTNVKDATGGQSYLNSSRETETHLKSDASFALGKRAELSAGTGLKLISLSHSFYVKADTSRWFDLLNGTGFWNELNLDEKPATYKTWAYAQVTLTPIPELTLTPGLRVDQFEFLNDQFAVSPRFSVRYRLKERTFVSASAGIFYQTPPYLWLTGDPKNKNLKQMRADHIILGLEHLLEADLRLTLDFYHKEYSQYPVAVAIPSFVMSNAGTDPGAVFAGELKSAARGRARGIEFFLQKKLTVNYYATLSYAYSSLEFTGLDGVSRSGRHDYRNVLSAVFGYRFSHALEISGKWTYMGGAPYTPVNTYLSQLLGREILDVGRINDLRYPAYHRLDLRVDYRFILGSMNVVTYLDVQNVYNRKNMYYYVWSVKEARVIPVYQWPLLPVFGLNVAF